MKVPCSLSISALGSNVESPLHALQANCDADIEFWRVSARGSSPTPALDKFSCVQPSGDPLADVQNYYNYVLSHTWTNGPVGHQVGQTDTLDASTLMPTTSTIDIDDDGILGGIPFPWNDNLGYFYGADATSTAGADWDKSGTRSAITTALDAVNWSNLWAGNVSEPNNFAYDRANIAPDQSETLPYGGGNTGDLVASHIAIGPNLTLTGRVGEVSSATEGGFSVSEALGVSLERAQLQIRNYTAPTIPYFIYEKAGIAAGVTLLGSGNSTVKNNANLSLADTHTVFRKISDGTWDHDLQIVQLPDAAMDGPQTISAGVGTGVRNGTAIGMVVGKTFEQWMEDNLGPTWADYVFS